jgi:hypothetical protein
MASPDKPISLKDELQSPIRLNVTPPRYPLTSFLKSMIFANTRGKDQPEKITLRADIFERFDKELRDWFSDTGWEVPVPCERVVEAGCAHLLIGVPIGRHDGETGLVLHLPDYGVLP